LIKEKNLTGGKNENIEIKDIKDIKEIKNITNVENIVVQ
jgi:hypothetical protein